MNQNLSNRERGQILVILVLALVGLLAFTSLAIDIGMVFSDRRYYQNVADAAALAAVEKASEAIRLNQYIEDGRIVTGIDSNGFDCGNSLINPNNPLSSTNPPWSDTVGWNPPEFLSTDNPHNIARLFTWIDVLDAAHDRALTNNVVISPNDLSDQNGVVMRCVQEGTVDLSGETKIDNRYLEIRVMASGITSTSLAHFFFGGVMRNTVEAVVQIQSGSPIGFGDAILALNDTIDCQHTNIGSILFDGGPTVIAVGGSITSNRCMKTQAGNAYVRVLATPPEGEEADPNSCTQDEDAIRYMYTTGQPINADICPPPQPMEKPVRRQILANPPTCQISADLPDRGTFRQTNNSANGEINPGVYRSITVNGGNLTVYPGLYCINGDFSFTGGNIHTVEHTATGSWVEVEKGCDGDVAEECGVTFWMNSTNGKFTLNGNGEMVLSAPASDANRTHQSYTNLLIGGPDTYTGTVDLEGNSDDILVGVVYIPFGELIVGGTSNLHTSDPLSNQGIQLYTQLIADRIKFHGTTDIGVYYDASRQIMGTTTLLMSR